MDSTILKSKTNLLFSLKSYIKKLNHAFLLTAIFSLGFSKSIWLVFPSFYVGKFSYLATINITFSIFLLFTTSILGIFLNFTKFKKNLKNFKLYHLLFLIFFTYKSFLLSPNSIFAIITLISFIFYLQTVSQKTLKQILLAFIYGTLFQAALAIYQFLAQSSSPFTLLHFLGEPTLSTTTKGISKFSISNHILLRSYGTTNHPNFLATLLLLSTLSAQTINFFSKPYSYLNNTLHTLTLITTFSLSGITAYTIHLLQKTSRIFTKPVLLITITSLFLIITTLKFSNSSYQGITDRLFQLQQFFNTPYTFSELLLGKFNLNLFSTSTIKLQPWEAFQIHNHFLYFFQAFGLAGYAILFTFLHHHKQHFKSSFPILLPLLPILLFDNLFFTLSNGILAISIIYINFLYQNHFASEATR